MSSPATSSLISHLIRLWNRRRTLHKASAFLSTSSFPMEACPSFLWHTMPLASANSRWSQRRRRYWCVSLAFQLKMAKRFALWPSRPQDWPCNKLFCLWYLTLAMTRFLWIVRALALRGLLLLAGIGAWYIWRIERWSEWSKGCSQWITHRECSMFKRVVPIAVMKAV